MNRVATIAAALAFGLVAGAGVAVAVDPVEPEVINACAANNNGSLRLLADGETCNAKKETPVSWNVEGIRGPEGPAGVGSPVKIVDGNGEEVPGSFFGGTPSIVRDGFVWQVGVDGATTAVARGLDLSTLSFDFFTDSECTVALGETPVVSDAVFDELGISNLAVQYNGSYFARGGAFSADLFWLLGSTPGCQPTNPGRYWELGASLQKPADFVGRISVVAR